MYRYSLYANELRNYQQGSRHSVILINRRLELLRQARKIHSHCIEFVFCKVAAFETSEYNSSKNSLMYCKTCLWLLQSFLQINVFCRKAYRDTVSIMDILSPKMHCKTPKTKAITKRFIEHSIKRKINPDVLKQFSLYTFMHQAIKMEICSFLHKIVNVSFCSLCTLRAFIQRL